MAAPPTLITKLPLLIINIIKSPPIIIRDKTKNNASLIVSPAAPCERTARKPPLKSCGTSIA